MQAPVTARSCWGTCAPRRRSRSKPAPGLDPSVHPSFTAKQGQYLAFIFYYTKIHGVAHASIRPSDAANAGSQWLHHEGSGARPVHSFADRSRLPARFGIG